MKKLLAFLVSYLFFGCTFESPFPEPGNDAGNTECKRSCKEAGAKGATYDTGPFGTERCACWPDGGPQ